MRLSQVFKTTGVAPWVKEKGYCEYVLARNFERSAPTTPINVHSTYWRFFTRAWRGKPEMYPIVGVWVTTGALVAGIVAWTLSKPDLYIDKTQKELPWDWSRLREGKYKNNKARLLNYTGEDLSPDLPEVVIATQEKMLEAAKLRGTR